MQLRPALSTTVTVYPASFALSTSWKRAVEFFGLSNAPAATAAPTATSTGSTARHRISARFFISVFSLSLSRSGGHGGRVGPHDHGVGDLDDLGDGQARRVGVSVDRLRARRLVDAHGADALPLLEHVATDPADVVRHPLALGGRAGRSCLELL